MTSSPPSGLAVAAAALVAAVAAAPAAALVVVAEVFSLGLQTFSQFRHSQPAELEYVVGRLVGHESKLELFMLA